MSWDGPWTRESTIYRIIRNLQIFLLASKISVLILSIAFTLHIKGECQNNPCYFSFAQLQMQENVLAQYFSFEWRGVKVTAWCYQTWTSFHEKKWEEPHKLFSLQVKGMVVFFCLNSTPIRFPWTFAYWVV